MNDIILTSPNGTKYKLVVTDTGLVETIEINDNKDENVHKMNIISVIRCTNNDKHNELCHKLMNEGNKLVYINTELLNECSLYEKELIKDQYMHFINISNEVLFFK